LEAAAILCIDFNDCQEKINRYAPNWYITLFADHPLWHHPKIARLCTDGVFSLFFVELWVETKHLEE
jgi:hypothetical protein